MIAKFEKGLLMDGRWTLVVHGDDPTGIMRADMPLLGDEQAVPVVPCDDAAIERATAQITDLIKTYGLDLSPRELAMGALRGAGKTS